MNHQKKLLDSTRASLDNAAARIDYLLESVKEVEREQGKEVAGAFSIRDGGKGSPMTREYENLARSCMSTGMSADAYRITFAACRRLFFRS